MSQALYRRWRSQTFDEVVGQTHVTQTLRNALRDERVAHAYLFSGPRGTGKTSTARILAKSLNCAAAPEERPCNQCPTCIAISENRMIDLIEIDAASNNGVDDIRELREKVGFRPSEGRYKIYIIDEVHMLSVPAFNALLKTLEEPPPHARFILATTEPHKIPATVLSRCQRFDFRRIPAVEITDHLRHIAQEEGFSAEDEALMAIARSAQGCMRDAVSLLDQMLSFGNERIGLAQVQQALGTVSSQAVNELVNGVATKQVPVVLRLIQQLVLEGASLTEFCHQLIEHLRGVMVLQMADDASPLHELPPEVVRQMQTQAKQMALADTLFAIKRLSEAAPELKGSYQPQLPLEMALIEAIQGGPAIPVPQAAPAQQPAVAAGAPVAQGNGAASAGGAAAQPAGQPAAQAGAAANTGQANGADAAHDADGAADMAELPPLDEEAIKRLRTQWKTLQAEVKSSLGMKVWAALNSVRDVAVSDQGVAFAFGNNEFAQQMLAQPENHSRLSTILADFLGRPVQLECQLGEQAQLTRKVIVTSSVDEGGSDPLVDYAVKTLGAQIVEDNS